jgi:hypothetical protein
MNDHTTLGDIGVTSHTGIDSHINNNSIHYADPLTTPFDMVTYNGTSLTRLPIGTNGSVLMSDSSLQSKLKWGTLPTYAAPTIFALTTGFTISTSHVGNVISLTLTGDVAVTVPLNATTSIANGSTITILNLTTQYVVTLSPASSAITLRGKYGNSTILGEYTILTKYDTNSWYIYSTSLQVSKHCVRKYTITLASAITKNSPTFVDYTLNVTPYYIQQMLSVDASHLLLAYTYNYPRNTKI